MVSVLYAEISFFCALLLVIILNRTSNVLDFSNSSKSFIILVLFSFLFTLVDTLWGLIDSGIVPFSTTILTIVTYIFHILASVTIFFWFLFTVYYFGEQYYKKKIYRIIPIVLLVFEITLVVLNIFTKDLFYIEENYKYVSGFTRRILLLVQTLNFLILFIASYVIFYKNRNDKELKAYYKDSVFFTFIPMFTIILQIFFPEMPIYSLGFTLACFSIYSFVITYENTQLMVKYQNELNENKLKESMKRDYAIISSLTGSYDLVALVDVIQNSINLFQIDGPFKKQFEMKENESELLVEPSVFDKALRSIIPEEDFESFLKNVDRNMIMEKISKGQRFVVEIRGKDEDKISHFRMYFVYDKEKENSVLIGIKNVDKEYKLRQEIENQKQYISNLEIQTEMAVLMASMDGLTGLLNKISFIEKVEEYIINNTSVNSALIFFDMDHFKSINDVFGHAKGDEALREMAKKLKGMFRTNELIGRMGGDEFCIFLPHVTKEIVVERIESMNEHLRAVYQDENATIKTSASIGCVYCEKENLSYVKMHEIADEAMYEVKERGRDGHELKIY